MVRTKKSELERKIAKLSPIKIGAEFYHVHLFPQDAWPDGDSNQGLVDAMRREIHIRVYDSGMGTVSTLFHECLHVIAWDRVSDAFATSPEGKEYTYAEIRAVLEEQFVESYEAGLPALFLDNPGILDLFSKYWRADVRSRREKPERKKK